MSSTYLWLDTIVGTGDTTVEKVVTLLVLIELFAKWRAQSSKQVIAIECNKCCNQDMPKELGCS